MLGDRADLLLGFSISFINALWGSGLVPGDFNMLMDKLTWEATERINEEDLSNV